MPFREMCRAPGEQQDVLAPAPSPRNEDLLGPVRSRRSGCKSKSPRAQKHSCGGRPRSTRSQETPVLRPPVPTAPFPGLSQIPQDAPPKPSLPGRRQTQGLQDMQSPLNTQAAVQPEAFRVQGSAGAPDRPKVRRGPGCQRVVPQPRAGGGWGCIAWCHGLCRCAGAPAQPRWLHLLVATERSSSRRRACHLMWGACLTTTPTPPHSRGW